MLNIRRRPGRADAGTAAACAAKMPSVIKAMRNRIEQEQARVRPERQIHAVRSVHLKLLARGVPARQQGPGKETGTSDGEPAAKGIKLGVQASTKPLSAPAGPRSDGRSRCHGNPGHAGGTFRQLNADTAFRCRFRRPRWPLVADLRVEQHHLQYLGVGNTFAVATRNLPTGWGALSIRLRSVYESAWPMTWNCGASRPRPSWTPNCVSANAALRAASGRSTASSRPPPAWKSASPNRGRRGRTQRLDNHLLQLTEAHGIWPKIRPRSSTTISFAVA